MGDMLLVRCFTSRARASMETSSVLPTFTTSPMECSVSIRRTRDFDGVADIAEAARLFAVAINADGSVVERGLHEIRQDHAVAASLPRTYGIEQAHDDDGKLLFFPVRKREKFVQSLRSGVAPAAFCGGPENEVGVFMERHVGIFAVDFRCGGGENEFALFAGGFQDPLRSVDVGLDGANRTFHDQFHADGGREVDHRVGIIDEFGHQLAVLDVVQVIFHAIEALEMTNVVHAAGGQIVEQHDAIAAVEQPLREMRTDETSAASD